MGHPVYKENTLDKTIDKDRDYYFAMKSLINIEWGEHFYGEDHS